ERIVEIKSFLMLFGVTVALIDVNAANSNLLEALKTSKPKVKGIVLQEPSESTTTTTISSQGLSQDKGKGILVEPENPLKKKDQLKLDEEIALKLQAEIDEEERIARAEEEKIDEANIAWDDIQAKVDVDYQLAERLQAEEQEQFTIEEKATLFKELLEQRRKHFAAKRAEEKRNKPPTKTQQKKIMITYLKNMEGWKHKDLKSKDFDSIKELFDKAFTRVNMFVDFRTELVEGSSKRAGEELEQESTKKQKVDEDKDTAELQSLMEVIPDEEEVAIDVVPLATKSPSIVDWKIHKEGKKSYYQIVRANGKSQMYRVFSEMLKSFTRYKVLSWKLFDSCGVHCLSLQSGMIYMLGKIVGIKSFLMLFGVTAALIDVNAAQSNTKLLLLEEVTTASGINVAGGVNAASEEVSTAELGEELGLEGMDEEDEVPLVNGVLMGAFGGVGELGLLEGGGMVTSSSFVKSMMRGFFHIGLTMILGFLLVVVEEEDVMDERRLRRMRMV
ncbi:hypothetical protein Tco_1278825, partial [Tanacetum coccineum]